jgi:hypothetical protein
MYALTVVKKNEPWNKNKLVGQKRPLTLQQIWAIRIRLELANNPRNLAMFNLGIDSKLRGSDLLSLKVRDVAHGKAVQSRAMVIHRTKPLPAVGSLFIAQKVTTTSFPHLS